MKRFQELLMKDLGWKLLSVAIAAIMWFMVINITQPIDSRNYSRPLTIENLETLTSHGLTVGNMEELKAAKVTAKIKAQRTALDRLNQNPEWVQASVDLSGLSYTADGDVVALPVDITMQSGLTGYEVVSKTPAVVEVHIEKLETKELPVEVILDGKPEEELPLSEPILSRETVKVSGPASLVRKVASVRAVVEAEALQTTSIVTVSLGCYDAAGAIIKGVSTEVSEVTVSYTLLDTKDVPVHVEITGTPAAGYQVGDTLCSPATITLQGSAEDLKNILYLQMDSIDVSGRSASVTRSFNIEDYLPENITLPKDSSRTVQITVEITQQNGKSLTLQENDLTILGQESGKSYHIGTAHVTASGSEDALRSLTAAQLGGSIYLNGLDTGEHQVMVHFDLPDGVSVLPTYISVTVINDNDTSADD